MQVAVAGKGGSGKTTIAGTLARVLARRGHRVRAVDADSNPNLGTSLGLRLEDVRALTGLPSGLLALETDELGNRRTVLTRPVAEIFEEFAVEAPDGVRLLVASRIDHAGTG
jgi:CO dehydrogenase maturation factor